LARDSFELLGATNVQRQQGCFHIVLKQVSLGYCFGKTWLLEAPPWLWSLSGVLMDTFDATNFAVGFVVFCLPLFLLCIQRVIKFWGS
jgi:hypothetical protein